MLLKCYQFRDYFNDHKVEGTICCYLYLYKPTDL